MALDPRTKQKLARQKLEAEAALHLRKGRLKKAAETYAKIVAVDPDDDRLFIKLAELRLKLGDEPGARDAFSRAADASEKKGFYLRAMAALRQLARYLPPPQRPWTRLAELALRLGLVADALGFLDEGVRAWEAAGDAPKVMEALKRAQELSADDAKRALRLGQALVASGRRGDALVFVAAEADRHREAGRDDAWLLMARELVALDPDDAVVGRQVAKALIDRGEARRALQVLQPLIQGKEDEEALRLSARALADAGQPARRAAALKRLAGLMTRDGRALQAVAVWREVLEVEPGDTEALAALGLTPPPVVPKIDEPLRAAAIEAYAEAAAAERPRPTPPPMPVVLAPPPAVTPPPRPVVLAPPPAPIPAPAEPPEVAAALEALEDEELIDLDAAGVVVEEEDEAPIITPSVTMPAFAFAGESPHLGALEPDILHELGDELAHAEFLVAHRFTEEARELLAELSAAHPGHEGLAALAAKLEAGREHVQPVAHLVVAEDEAEDEDLVSLDELMASDDLDTIDAVLAGEESPSSAEAALDRFRQEVSAVAAADEASTHYDQGIAYRELGLVVDAVAEFELALLSAEGPRAVDCLLAVALCQVERGDRAAAQSALERALAHQALTADSAAAAHHELGLLAEAAGELAVAADAFDAADRAVPGFRDARAHAARLRGTQEQTPEGEPLPFNLQRPALA